MDHTQKIALLDMEWDFPQVGATTIRGYLTALLECVWHQKDFFTFKRAFGYSGWRRDLLRPFVAAGAITAVDDDAPVRERAVALLEQEAALDALIASLIPLVAGPAKTDGQGFEACFAYMSEIFGAGMKSQSEILNAVHRVRGFVDAAAQFKGLPAHDFEAMQRQIMAFALLYEERLDPQPSSRGLYLV